MNVEWMYFVALIDDAPMLIGANLNRKHWGRIHHEFLAVDVETILIFRKDSRELRLGLLHGMRDRQRDRLIHGSARILNDRPRSTRTAFRHKISKHHRPIWIAVRSSVEATGMKRCAHSGLGAGNNRFHSSSRCKQHVAHPSAADLRLVKSKGHPVQFDDVEGPAVACDISVKIGTGIHNAPKLIFSRSTPNFTPTAAIDSKLAHPL